MELPFKNSAQLHSRAKADFVFNCSLEMLHFYLNICDASSSKTEEFESTAEAIGCREHVWVIYSSSSENFPCLMSSLK